MGHMSPWIIFGAFNPVIEALYGLTALPNLDVDQLAFCVAKARRLALQTKRHRRAQTKRRALPGQASSLWKLGSPSASSCSLASSCSSSAINAGDGAEFLSVPIRMQPRRRFSLMSCQDVSWRSVESKQGALPPEPPAGTGAAHTVLSFVESLGPPEMNSMSMPPPYEETQGNRVDAP